MILAASRQQTSDPVTTDKSIRSKQNGSPTLLMASSPVSSEPSIHGGEYSGHVAFNLGVHGVPYLGNANWKQEYLQRFNQGEDN